MTIEAKQGFAYLYKGEKVIALETGSPIRVLLFDAAAPWLGNTDIAYADELTPLPSRYLHGSIPK